MGNYRSQYEKYYGNIKKKANISTESKEFGLHLNKKDSKKLFNKIIDKLIKQLVGTFFLLGFLIIIKDVNLEEARLVYAFSKNTVNYNLNIKDTIVNISLTAIEEYNKLLEVVEYNMK